MNRRSRLLLLQVLYFLNRQVCVRLNGFLINSSMKKLLFYIIAAAEHRENAKALAEGDHSGGIIEVD
jgi:hypothetical protein